MIILDIGSRNGESLEEFVRWPFEVIHAFEPMPAQFANVQTLAATDERIAAHNYGLSDTTATKTMYGADENGEASVFATKVDLDPSVTTDCAFVEASTFFADLDDGVIVKMNCEGSEVAILNNLLDSGEIWKISALRFEMDISRCVGHEEEADLLLARLDEAGFDRYVVSSDARLVNGGLVERMDTSGTHHERLHGWLESVWES